MARRTPTSILLLIDRRNRLEGELVKLAALKREASDLHAHVKKELAAASEALSGLEGQFDEERIRPTYSVRSSARHHFGLLTRLILGALREAKGRPLTQSEIATWVEARWPGEPSYVAEKRKWQRNLNKRLGGLRHKRVLVSPQVGNGYSSSSTWTINPELVITGLDTDSTLFDDADLGSSRRTTAKDRSDGSD